MGEFHYIISDGKGLHARKAMQLAKAAETCQCAVSLICGEKAADAKTIISLMSITVHFGENIVFR